MVSSPGSSGPNDLSGRLEPKLWTEDLLGQTKRDGTLLLLAGVHARPLIAIERSGLLERIGEDNALPDVRTALDRARAIVATSR